MGCTACPAPGGLARAGRARQAGRVPGRGLLGPPGARLRRPGRSGGDRRAGAGRPRGQPHGSDVHRRPVRRLPLRLAVPDRLRQPTHQHRTATTACGSPAPGSPRPSGARRPPTNRHPIERDTCRPFLERELALLDARVFVPLGAFAYDGLCRILGVTPRPRFAHGIEVPVDDRRSIVGSFHVSQQNTFTGKLTEPMLDAVLRRARSSQVSDQPEATDLPCRREALGGRVRRAAPEQASEQGGELGGGVDDRGDG